MLLQVPFSTVNVVNFSCVSEELKLMVRWWWETGWSTSELIRLAGWGLW